MNILDFLFGNNPKDSIHVLQMINRMIVIYFYGLILIRLHERFFGLKTTHDLLLRITIGSIFAAVIVGEAALFSSLMVIGAMTMVNWVVSFICYHSPFLEKIIKGIDTQLVRNGKIIWKNMRKFHITREELIEASRLSAHTDNLQNIKKAYLENDGEISIVNE